MEKPLILNNERLAFRMGRAWFKCRSFSPIPFILLFFILKPDFFPSLEVRLFLLGLVLVSEGLRIWAVGFAGSSTRTRGDSVPVLVVAGPYRWVRNPLYIANIGMYSAVGFLFGQWYLSIAFFFYSCLQYSFIVHYEETILEKIFGEPYQQFKHEVPRWMPRTNPARATSDHSFSLLKAIKSEKSTFYSMMGVTLLFSIKHFFLSA